ncbi:CPBP family intramembrane glutamic endopeptidase [Zobellia galactanivorans]|uniref:CAAX prenyl peptidase, family U48 n=1 Tax=Zobellia galactanivorans (strain DSM 12802 / CCUG 47099 / CIP 106680 / NCIMB 13871 / Dsij) TaxID=63186 RepID=G0L0B5_ZOBGA|nr:type II CAAX endopeptidase family protein [Zobellia galactanivorans]CAZ94240.1 CAAX prenyl peptidase, family U48 [Zobellia galactanivorans]
MEEELKPFWGKIFNFDWKFGFFLILLICIPRFALVLQANQIANYSWLGLIMLISALVPFLFLSKLGRRKIGLKKPDTIGWLGIAFVIGAVFSILLYHLGAVLYGNTFENWYYYIAQSYNIPTGIDEEGKLVLFSIMAVTGMTFSPIGEELFFRGIVHSSMATSLGDRKASLIDSSAFALVHISHFGLVFVNQEWKFLLVPTLIWVLSMFCVSILFYICRMRSGSILGAIVCHAAFNLGMIYCIFYQISG